MTTIRDHWEKRAEAGDCGGTPDLVARELERRVLAEYLTDGMRVLDAGCGDGGTARYLADRFPNMRIHGIDYVPARIGAALQAEQQLRYDVEPRVTFAVGDLHDPPPGPWDASWAPTPCP